MTRAIFVCNIRVSQVSCVKTAVYSVAR